MSSPPEQPNVFSIVIPNWNGAHHLPPCLAALRTQTYPALEIIVVDNASTDGSQALLTKQYPEVKLIDPYQPELKPEEGLELRRQGLTADVMIASSNAITLDGKLVNLDGMGNRVAAMAFGPKKVILLVGMNKVVPDLESAMTRVKHYAAPINNIRLAYKNPCTETGLCNDCSTPQRICNLWSIIEGHMIQNRIHVKLIGENLGY